VHDQHADGDIDSVVRLTSGVGRASSMPAGSVLTAVEALQEAETEVGVAVILDRGADAGRAAVGRAYRATCPMPDLGLTA
jgi:hypothetical protein